MPYQKPIGVRREIGLAMARGSSGLFVGAHVGSSIAALTFQGFLVVMMIVGAIGFYLGIDTPPPAFRGPNDEPSKGSGRIDTAEFLSAVGTFLATLAAFVSVGVIVLRKDPRSLDNNNNAGVGSWRGDANPCRSNRTQSHECCRFRLSPGTCDNLCLCARWPRCAAQWNGWSIQNI
jgi:hypothetical protein